MLRSFFIAANDTNKPSGPAITLESITITEKYPAANSLNTSVIDADIILNERAATSDTAKLLRVRRG